MKRNHYREIEEIAMKISSKVDKSNILSKNCLLFTIQYHPNSGAQQFIIVMKAP